MTEKKQDHSDKFIGGEDEGQALLESLRRARKPAEETKPEEEAPDEHQGPSK